MFKRKYCSKTGNGIAYYHNGAMRTEYAAAAPAGHDAEKNAQKRGKRIRCAFADEQGTKHHGYEYGRKAVIHAVGKICKRA